jgi:Tfp pilus assembly protein PilZ
VDLYESYIDKESGNPLKYVRKINEGGYVKNQEGFLINQTIVFWLKIINRNEKTFVTQKILKIYYLRSITCKLSQY